MDYVIMDGRKVQAEGGAAIVDKGSGDYAFDGQNVIAGQEGLYWSSALRLVKGAGAFAGGYDANGNLTSRVVDGAAFLLTYDAENRLTSVSGAANASFVYDGDGNRVKGTVSGATTTYVGNYFEWTGSTSTMVKYYYAGSQRVAMRVGSSTLYWLFGDHLGSTSKVANRNGAQQSEQRYKAWGETRYTSGTLPTKYTFTGQYSHVGDFGLMYYGARWYDLALGRFSQPDSIVPIASQGEQAWDRYAYVNNNPIRFVDPTGHDRDCSAYEANCSQGVHSRHTNARISTPYYDPEAIESGVYEIPIAIDIPFLSSEDCAENCFSQYPEGEPVDPIGAVNYLLQPWANAEIVASTPPDAEVSIFFNIYESDNPMLSSSIVIPGVWVTNDSQTTFEIQSIKVGKTPYDVGYQVRPGDLATINLPDIRYPGNYVDVRVSLYTYQDDPMGGYRFVGGRIWATGYREPIPAE